jgi:hypothetical protein
VPHARARSLARLAAPGRAVGEGEGEGEGEACRVETETTVMRMHCFCHSYRSFMSIIISCIKTTVTGN